MRNLFKFIMSLVICTVVFSLALSKLHAQSITEEQKKKLKELTAEFEKSARELGIEPRYIIQSVLDFSYNPEDQPKRDHEYYKRRKASRDSTFRTLSNNVLNMQKTSYRSSADDMEIPLYIFSAKDIEPGKQYPVLLWIHGGIHGDLDPRYFPFFREAVNRGYIVISPEYRGSTGYGEEHYNAIDYGGFEIDDCLSAVEYIRDNIPNADIKRIGVIGRSHGGFLSMHSAFNAPSLFKCAVSIVPVTNLIIRLSYKGPRFQLYHMTQPRVLGLPHDKFEIYKERSPYYNVHKLEIPLLVHVADNDRDVYYEESEMLIHKLTVMKSEYAEVKVYHAPPGAHSFDMLVDQETWTRTDSKEMRDSWNRVWSFLEYYLQPYLR